MVVGVCQHALIELAISHQLIHVASWFRTLSTCIELQNTIVYRSSPIEGTGNAYERCAKAYGTTFVRVYFLAFSSIHCTILHVHPS